MSYNILVCGSRFNGEDSPKQLIAEITDDLCLFLTDNYILPLDTFLLGGAKGVDFWMEECLRNAGATVEIYPAEWDKYGKQAGMIRNAEMVKKADFVVAAWDGSSKGTKHSIDLALKKGIPVHIFTYKLEDYDD